MPTVGINESKQLEGAEGRSSHPPFCSLSFFMPSFVPSRKYNSSCLSSRAPISRDGLVKHIAYDMHTHGVYLSSTSHHE